MNIAIPYAQRYVFSFLFVSLLCVGFTAHAGQTFGKMGMGGSSRGVKVGGKNVVLEPSVSYSMDSFENTIGYDDGNSPDVVSALSWEKMMVVRGNLKGKFQTGKLVVMLDGSYGHIAKGDFMDDDYGGNGRTLLWSQSKSKISGSLMDGFLGLGWRVSVAFTPMIGGFYSQQSLTMTETTQIKSSQANLNTFRSKYPSLPVPQSVPAVGAKFSHKPTYKATMFGPWVGGDMNMQISQGLSLVGDLRLMYAFYKAEGKWPTYTYKDTAKGYGAQAALGVGYDATQSLSLNLKIGGRYMVLNRGDVKIGSQVLKNYFRGATSKSVMLSLGGKYAF